MFIPASYRGSGSTPWIITDSREDARSLDELRHILADALAVGLGIRVIEEPAFHWHATTKLARSLFDCVRVEISLHEGVRSTSVVEVSFEFESTQTNVTAILLLTTSLIGLPLLYLWRAWSVGRVRSYSKHALGVIWQGLERGREPYR
jgi:hypothetical protein